MTERMKPQRIGIMLDGSVDRVQFVGITLTDCENPPDAWVKAAEQKEGNNA